MEMEQEVTIMKEFEQLKPFLLSAQLGSYVVLPLKYRKEELDQVWLKANCEKQDITTTNLTEQAKILFKENDPMHVGVCYKFQRETFIKELLDNIEVENVMGFAVTDLDQDRIELGINWEKDGFDIHSAYLYVFETGVAFLCMGLRYSRMDAIAQICNPGSADTQSRYFYLDNEKKTHEFSLDEKLDILLDTIGLEVFHRSGTSVFLDAFTYNLAMIGRRFRDLDTIRRVTCNQNNMLPLSTDVDEDMTGALQYLYAAQDKIHLAYNWGACVSDQAVSYVMADYNLNMEGQMKQHAEDKLPAVIIALYEKYTCQYLTEQAAAEDMKAKEKQEIKDILMHFQAFGVVRAMNLSRNYEIKIIYQHLLDMNGIEGSINDLDKKLNFLNEQIKDMAEKKQNHMMELVVGCCSISILSSVFMIMNLMGISAATQWVVLGTVIGIGVVGALVTMLRKTNVVSAFSENMEKLYDHFEAVKENVNETLAERAEAKEEARAVKEAAEEEALAQQEAAEKAAQEEVEKKESQQIIHIEDKTAKKDNIDDNIKHA